MEIAVKSVAVDQHGRVFAVDDGGGLWVKHTSVDRPWERVPGPDDGTPPATQSAKAEPDHHKRK